MKNLFLLLTFFLFITIGKVFAADHFWIGGTGNWSTVTSWSLTSGGAPTVTVPGTGDNAIFDASSGLIATSIVTVDVNAVMNDFDFSAVATTFTFDNTTSFTFEVQGSIISSASGISMTGTWVEIKMNALLAGESILSGGTLWGTNFRISGNLITLADNFDIGVNNLNVDNGGINTGGFSVDLFDFISGIANTRTIDLNNSIINFTGTVWTIDPTTLTWLTNGSTINVINPGAGPVVFTGGGQAYDSVRCNTTQAQIFDDNSFLLFESLQDFQLENSSTQNIDSLVVVGSCGTNLVIESVNNVNPAASINKTGYPIFTSSNLSINNVNALPAAVYNIYMSDTTSATGWTVPIHNFYWIGGTGVWSNGANWSATSGGTPLGCVPGIPDNVFFDANSGVGTDIVTLDIPVTIHDLDFSAINAGFTFAGVLASIELQGSINASAAANFTWLGSVSMNPSAPVSIGSNSLIWSNTFVFIGPADATILDDLNTSGDISVEKGGLIISGFTLTCNDFFSATANTRNIDLSNSIVNLEGTIWDITATSLTFNASLSTINTNNIGAVEFTGGGLTYDTVRVNSSSLNVFNSNTFSLLHLGTDSLNLDNATTQNIDSLVINGTCSVPAIIKSVDPSLASASIQINGNLLFYGSGLSINNVDALSPGSEAYYILLSDTTNGADNWTKAGSNFYWINNGGDWSNINQWSLSSGGAISGCLPTALDTVYFDNLSLTTTGEIIIVDSLAEFSKMDWTTTAFPSTLRLDTNIISYGDITLYPSLFVTRNDVSRSIQFKKQADFDPSSSLVDCNVAVVQPDSSMSVNLMNNIVMTDTSSLLMVNGHFNTMNNDMTLGTILSINNTASGADKRFLDFGTSTIDLKVNFNTIGDTTFAFNSGTSLLNLGDTLSYSNNLETEGLVFHDVTLNFKPTTTMIPLPNTPVIQRVKGNNTFNKLKVNKGSHVYFESGQTQIVNDSLIMIGDCRDSIFIASTDTSATLTDAFINKITAATFDLQCLNVSAMNNSGQALTTYFSDSTSTTNWVFNSTPPVNASFTANGPYCFGDTTLFTNTSVPYSGNSSDFTTQWYYNDTSTGYFLNPPTDSTWINFEVDTLQHVFLVTGDVSVNIVTTYKNFCENYDTVIVHINNPQVVLIPSSSDTTLCAGESISFIANGLVPNLQYEFFLNGVSQNTPSITDTLYTTNTLVAGDTVGLLAYEGGCVTDSMEQIVYNVTPLPVFTWLSNPASPSCDTDSVAFVVTPTNVLDTFTYQFFINDNIVASTPVGFYWSDTLNNSDTISVFVTDSLGCQDSTSTIFTVNPLPIPVLTESTGGNVICDGDAVIFTASGANTYEFFVDGISQGAASTATSLSLDTLNSGNMVSVIGYTALGCSIEAPQTFSYTVNTLPNVGMTLSDADTSICSSNSVTFNASGASQFEFFINGVSVQGPGSTSSYTTTTLANDDTVYVQGAFSGCAQKSDSAIFEVLTSPTTTLISDDTDASICAQTSVLFTAAGATNYEFFVDGISVQGPGTTTTYTTSSLNNGEVISVMGESNTCTISQAITFTVLSIPSVGLFSDDPDDAICQGDVITFTGANAAQYELFVNTVSQGAAQVSPTFTPTLAPGPNSVYLIGTSANGCTNTSATTLNIAVTATPIINLTSSDTDDIICAGETVTFTGSGSDQFQFLIDGVTQGAMSNTNTLTTSNLLNGQVVTINGQTNSCPATSNPLTYTVNPIPTIGITSDDINNNFCTSDLVTFTASGATNYEFFVDGVSQGPSSATSSITSAGFVPGSYNINVTGEQNSCVSNSSISIIVNALPIATLTSSDLDNTICASESVTYTGSGGNSYEFEINNVSQGPSSNFSSFTTTTLANNDVVGVIVTSNAGCISTDVLTAITVNTTPVTTISSSDIDMQICSNENVIFTGAGAIDYEFFLNGISQGSASPTTTLSLNTLANNDDISVIGSEAGCFSTSSTLNFVVFNAPLVLFNNNGTSDICTGELTNLVATGATNYEFFVNGTSTGPSSPVNTFTSPLNNGDIVTVDGESNNCIASSTSNYTFIVNTYPTLATTSSDADDIICRDDQVDFTASGATTYIFDINGTPIQTGTTSTYGLNTLMNGDVVSITGFNGDCPSTIDTYTFTVNSMILDMTVAASSMICEGESVTFTASGGDEYEFFLNGTSTAAMSATNTYTSTTLADLDEVTYTALSNTTTCTQAHQDYVIMNVIATPTITPLSATTFCDGDSVELISNATYGNQWFVDGVAIAGEIDSNYTALTSGDYSLDVTSGGLGVIWSFGANATGTFGNGDNFNNSEPTQANTAIQFDEVSSGADFVLGVSNTGDVYAWGENSSGQLGDGTYTNTNLPNQVPTLANVKTVATTESSSMAVTATGDVYVWGNNTVGQLGTGNTSVINFPMANAAIANTDSIAGGKTHFVILRNDGTVWTVGSNDFGQLGQGDLITSMVPVQVVGLSNVTSIGAGEYHSFAIDNNGDLYVWGNNGSGQLGLDDLNGRLSPALSPLRNVINAQGGATHSAFLTNESKVFVSGGNTFGQLGTGNNVDVQIPTEVAVPGAKMISTGQYTTLVKRSDNSVFGFGNNTEDQLSSATGTTIITPEHISDLDGVSFIEAGKSVSHVLYNETKLCTSPIVSVTVLPVPVVTITNNIDTLSTIPGAAYQWYIDGAAIPGANAQTYVANTSGNYTVDVTSANGCVGTSPVYYHSMTSVKDLTLGKVVLYPNPTNSILNISFEKELIGESTVTILDQAGRIVYNDRLDNGFTNSIDVNSLEDGVYHITIINNENKVQMRFIKTTF